MAIYKFIVVLSIHILVFKTGFAQPTWTFDPFGKEKKPEKFENRKLGSEKTGDKKFTKPRHFLQNTVTHYNYFFNANNKINAVIERAKISHQDDFSQLLSFYSYSLDNTASEKAELDSVIYKATAGILLHDLRNDWVDNLYLLVGKSYYFRKDFDSAGMTFQFINYNLFPRKKKEDEDRIVGTNAESVGNFISISNKENRNLLQKMLSLPPSRNDALIWMTRTLTEQEDYGEASGLINILYNDVNLPKRLQDDLNEVNAYWFYKQRMYDSSAVYLEKALSNADTKNDKARWEFLLAQLFEINNDFEKASDYYAKAAKHTVDPLMNIYAQLNDAKMFKNKDDAIELDKNITALLKMARKDKFDSYRDIIYYSAGELSLYKPDTTAAMEYFLKSIKYNVNNMLYKNKSFLRMADIAYARKEYKNALAYYDSLQISDPFLASRLDNIQLRKNTLGKIIEKINNIEMQDSLFKIAAMPENDRETYIKKLLKKLQKQNVVKQEQTGSGNTAITFANNNQPANIFTEDGGEEWYFYNNSLKSKGFNEFKNKWGDRKNTDNWRRKSAENTTSAIATDTAANQNNTETDIADAAKININELSFEGLMNTLPLTPGRIDTSNKIISVNLFLLGKLYQNELEEYQLAINAYEEHIARYPSVLFGGELYLNLFYCYSKLGNIAKRNYYKNLLNEKFAGSKFAATANNPLALNPKKHDPVVTKLYEGIYNLFIEGGFTEALSQKKKADSVHGTNYWSPQLLYIESVYYIRQRSDSVAIATLEKSIELFPQSIMVPKTRNLIDVLKRRDEIENYLTNLDITRAQEDKLLVTDDGSIIKAAPAPVDTVKKIVRFATDTVKKIAIAPVDTIKKIIPPIDTVKKVITPPVDTVKKVIPVPVDTVKKITPPIDTVKIVAPPVDTVTKAIPVPVDTVKKIITPPVDTIKKIIPPPVDTVRKTNPALTNGVFTMAPDAPHNVIMILEKVDAVYISEAQNAITRYNKENYKNQQITIVKEPLDANRTILAFTNFTDGNAALQYYLKLKKAAPTEIGWLPVNKYSFLIITNENLQILKNNKDVNGYKDLLNKQYANQF